MKVEYTGRQIEVSPAIQEFTEEHLKKDSKDSGRNDSGPRHSDCREVPPYALRSI